MCRLERGDARAGGDGEEVSPIAVERAGAEDAGCSLGEYRGRTARGRERRRSGN